MQMDTVKSLPFEEQQTATPAELEPSVAHFKVLALNVLPQGLMLKTELEHEM